MYEYFTSKSALCLSGALTAVTTASPLLTNGVIVTTSIAHKSTCPPKNAALDGAVPSKGTSFKSMPRALFN